MLHPSSGFALTVFACNLTFLWYEKILLQQGFEKWFNGDSGDETTSLCLTGFVSGCSNLSNAANEAQPSGPTPAEQQSDPNFKDGIYVNNHIEHPKKSFFTFLKTRFFGDDVWHDPNRVVALRWWQEAELTSAAGKITATPSQHWSSRSLTDRNETHWASWLVELNGFTFWYGGDTGYTDEYSNAIRDGKFVGFPFDNVNEKDKIPERLERWLEILKAELP